MRLTRYTPFKATRVPAGRNAPLDELFEGLWKGLTPVAGQPVSAWAGHGPRVDVSRTDSELRIEAELPGLAAEDVQLSIEEDTLVLSGESKQEKREEGSEYLHVERRSGSFRRVIPLPVEVDREKAEARFDKGVLTVTLPFADTEKDRVRRIEIAE